jgi:Spy/CpxP family protein refolding chaperone
MHELLGLSEEQGTSLRTEFESAKSRVDELQRKLDAEIQKLVEILKPARVDEAAAASQAETILDIERNVKRTQLKLMVFLKNVLTAEQQAKLDEIKRLDPKIRQVKTKVNKWRAEGRDVSEIERLGEEVKALMSQGKVAEVDGLLDRALKLIDGPAK